jgi:tripartite-type tricarboxylate transporter receptor subunit TctC
MKKKHIYSLLFIGLLALALLFTGCSNQGADKGGEDGEVEYPTKPIELVVPYSAGGVSDIVARYIADTAKDYFPQPITVQNREGGSGSVGTTYLINANPDGHIMMFGSSSELSSGIHISEANYGMDDYEPVIGIGGLRVVLATTGQWEDYDEFIEYAKANPGKVVAGVPGSATVVHLTAERFAKEAGIELNFVPSQGSGPLVLALLGEHVDIAFLNVPEIINQYKAGEAKILAALCDERVGVMPDVPTVSEMGIEVSGGAVHFITLPKGVPSATKEYIHDTMKEIFEDPNFVKKCEDLGYVIQYNDEAGSRAFLKDWYDATESLYKELGLLD